MIIIDNYAMAVVYDVISAPIKYIDSLEKKQHIVLFYEDAEFARLVEFRFIKIGLDLGEQCLYATHEDSGSIILKFLTYGMPIEYFKSGRLRVCQILPVAGGDKETMFARYKMELTKLVKDLRPPFRMVSRIVPDVSTMDGISIELELERIMHGCFDDFGGSLICPYAISEIEKTKRSEWLRNLRDEHHAVIYILEHGKAGVITSLDVASDF